MENSGTVGVAGRHCPWKLALIILHGPVFIVTMAINYMSTPAFPQSAIFESDTGTISDQYDTKITPAGWTFTIWAFIYIWQLIHVVYSFTLLCRRGSDGQYLYMKPGPLHYSFYIVYMINNILNIGWILVFDRSGKRQELLVVAMILLWLITFTLYVCGVLICRYLSRAGASLELSGNVKDIWMIRIFVLNGIAFYGTWVTIASLLNFAIVLQFDAGLDMLSTAWICLGILSAELVAWFILETFVFDKHLRYCFSQYITLLIALSGLLSKHYDSSSPEAYTIYVMFLLCLSGLLGLVKLVVMIVRGIRNPISYNNTITPTTKGLESQNSTL